MGKPNGGRRAHQPGNAVNNSSNTQNNKNNNSNNSSNNGNGNGNNSSKNRRRKNSGRGRGRNGNFSNSNKSGKNKTPPPLQLPHAKITIRKISNVEKFGSRTKMADFIRCLCGSSSSPNPKQTADGNFNIHIALDEHSITKNCTDLDPYKNSDDKKDVDGVQTDENEKNAEVPPPEPKKLETKSQETSGTSTEQPNSADNDKSTSNQAFSQISEGKKNIVTARVLYVTPPRRSRRRGIITGAVYLVLYPPDPTKPNTPVIATNTATLRTENETNASTNDGSKDDALNSSPATIPVSDGKTASNPQSQSIILVGQERSKAVATARLTLQNAQEYLTSQAITHSNTLGECIVELSPSQKTWKDHSGNEQYKRTSGSKRSERGDRYENTIFSTEDYRKFLEGITKKEEELASRPKPLPGGGEIDTTVTSSTSALGLSSALSDNNNTSNSNSSMNNNASNSSGTNNPNANVPMSALAKYLNDKKKEQKAKQLAKRNASTASASSSNTAMTSNKKKMMTGSVKVLDKSNAKKKRAGSNKGNHGNSKSSEKNSGAPPSKKSSSSSRKEKKKRKEKKNASKQGGDMITTPILMKNPSSSSGIMSVPVVLSNTGADKSKSSKGGNRKQ